MIVRKSTYEAKCREHLAERALHVEWKNAYFRLREKWNDLVPKWHHLLEKPPQFTQDDIQRLILLCHPDKHDGKAMATEMTQKLLKLKE